MRSLQVEQKINEVAQGIFQQLGIPYSPYESSTDPRAMVIANGLTWIADFVAEQYEQGER